MNRRQLLLVLASVALSALISAIVTTSMVTAHSKGLEQSSAVSPSGGPSWEYQIVFGTPKNASYATSQLNKLSTEGYEVVGYSAATDEVGRPSYSVLLRRMKR